IRGIIFAIEPLEDQFAVGDTVIPWKSPSDVIALRPCVAPTIWGILPGFLNFCAHAKRNLKSKTLPNRVKNVAADVSGPACSEVLPRAPFGRVINVWGIRPERCRAKPRIPFERVRRWRALGWARPL